MLLRVLTILLLVYIGFGALLYFAQRTLMYMPVGDRKAADEHFEWVRNGDESIRLWVVSPGRDKAVIYFGGNAEDVYYNAPEFRDSLPNHTVYLVNYRGYGGSTGSPTQKGLFADALAIFDGLRQRHAEISAIGRSLGSGVAVYLAAERPVDKLILVTPHDSVRLIAEKMYPLYPVSLLLKDKYESIEYAPNVTASTLLLVAEYDQLIPVEHSSNLYRHFRPGLAEQWVIANAGHNGISGYSEYWRSIGRFIDTPSALEPGLDGG